MTTTSVVTGGVQAAQELVDTTESEDTGPSGDEMSSTGTLAAGCTVGQVAVYLSEDQGWECRSTVGLEPSGDEEENVVLEANEVDVGNDEESTDNTEDDMLSSGTLPAGCADGQVAMYVSEEQQWECRSPSRSGNPDNDRQ